MFWICPEDLSDTEDQEWFFSLYHQYRNLMYSVAKDILQDSHEAEDAVSEAFIRIFQHFESNQDVFCPETKSFVVILTRRICLDMLRKAKRDPLRQRMKDADAEEMILQTLADPLHDLDNMTGYSSLLECIEAMPNPYRDILYLRYIMGYSVPETAKILQVSLEVIYKRTVRARNMLRDRMAAWE